MAKALIIEDEYGALATAYYKKIPDEPISAKASFTIESVDTIPETSLLTTLNSILKVAQAGTDLVLVSHGNERGLTMGLTPKFGRVANTDNLNTLTSEEPLDKIADKFSLKPEIVKDILEKAAAVRKLKIGHVAFRGCSIGAATRNLVTLKEFLGATEVSGTSLLSTFGEVTPIIPKKQRFEGLWKANEKRAHRSGDAGKRVIFARSAGKEPLTDVITLFIESKEALHPWIQRHFLAGATKDVAISMENNARVHYLLRTPPVVPLNNGGVTYGDFMFFASAG